MTLNEIMVGESAIITSLKQRIYLKASRDRLL